MTIPAVATEGDPEPKQPFFFYILLIAFVGWQCQSSPASPTHQHMVVKDTIPVGITDTSHASNGKKKIYLTFDDGPNKGTRNVLALVKAENVPVSFFIVGEHTKMSDWQKTVWDSLQTANGILLCNHSYTHALHNKYSKFYQNPDTVVKDIRQAETELQLKNHIVRAPGRNCWRIGALSYTDIKKSKPAIDSLQAAGFTLMGWDLEWHFNPDTLALIHTADEMLQKIDSVFRRGFTQQKGHLVLLAHDQVFQRKEDLAQLKILLEGLKRNSKYELLLANQYPGIGVDSLVLRKR